MGIENKIIPTVFAKASFKSKVREEMKYWLDSSIVAKMNTMSDPSGR